MSKSNTDVHWNERAITEVAEARVNIGDTAQRDVELHYILPHLSATDRILEVGCGNGFATEILRRHVRHVDAFDYAENMIERARSAFGETNNRFFHDNVLDPRHFDAPYDAVLCVRVLINLRNVDEQLVALRNLADAGQSGGRLILFEGYRDGFEMLSAVREQVGMPPLQPAKINFYSSRAELQREIDMLFEVEVSFHTGMFDVLTRVVYPALVGPTSATTSDYHEKIAPIAKVLNPDALAPYARLHGVVLVRR